VQYFHLQDKVKQCRGQSIRSRGAKSKSRGAKVFLLIFALKKHAVHNAITNINNFVMQSEIILIGVTSSKLLFPEHFCDYSE